MLAQVEFNRKIQIVQYIYQEDGIIDRIIEKNGLAMLVRRKNNLESYSHIWDEINSAMLSYALSYFASVCVVCIFPSGSEILPSYLACISIFLISVMLISIISLFIDNGDKDKIALYEFEELKINEKIKKYHSSISSEKEIECIAEKYINKFSQGKIKTAVLVRKHIK